GWTASAASSWSRCANSTATRSRWSARTPPVGVACSPACATRSRDTERRDPRAPPRGPVTPPLCRAAEVPEAGGTVALDGSVGPTRERAGGEVEVVSEDPARRGGLFSRLRDAVAGH